ncbi:Fe2+-dependent dioxygenase [Novosphingobium sp.]|uniref:Fe2+-dependent dioxygenase n=1 Tax=Novosphingobium sp. TaxID=1874826 RepID=UPI00333E80E5
MMITIPQVLTQDQVAALRALINHADAPWVDGRVTAGHQGASVKHNQQFDELSDAAAQAQAMVLHALECHPGFISAALPHRVYPPLFNRYGPGMAFGAHVDGAIRLHPHTGEKLRTDISATLFLNAPEDYDGGTLQIIDTYGTHAVKLPAGDLVLYPATSLHQVTPVTRGERLACFFWIESLVRDDTRRSIAYDLDTAIQRLNQTGADRAGIDTLVGCYHNLLRQWVTT